MKGIWILFVIGCHFSVSAQTGEELLKSVREKLEKVNDYVATGQLKTNVVFIKAPVAEIKVFYKKPDKLKIVNEKGISFIPRGSVNINQNKLMAEAGTYQLIDAGTESANGWRILKLLPVDENADIILSTVYIDEKKSLVRKTINTTRENGTYELEMNYGQYETFGLPDKIIFTFNTREYKLPKGVTFEYDDGSGNRPDDKMKNKKGRVEITYTTYTINKGIDESVFK